MSFPLHSILICSHKQTHTHTHTRALYFSSAIKFGDDNETFIILKIIRECISSTLPKTYSRLLYAILRLLQQCAKLSEINKMAPMNLGIVFGQCLFRQEEITAQMLQDAQHLNKAVALMIENTEFLFDLQSRPDLQKLERELFHSGSGLNGIDVSSIDHNEKEHETQNALYGVEETEYLKQGYETDISFGSTEQKQRPYSHSRMNSDSQIPFRIPGAVPTAGGGGDALMEQLKKRQSMRITGSGGMSLDERLAMEKKKREEERKFEEERQRTDIAKKLSSRLLKRQQSMDVNSFNQDSQHVEQESKQPQQHPTHNDENSHGDDDKDEDFEFSSDTRFVQVKLDKSQSAEALKESLFRGLLEREKWQELFDQGSSRKYYYHEPSRTTSWELPETLVAEFQKLALQVDQQEAENERQRNEKEAEEKKRRQKEEEEKRRRPREQANVVKKQGERAAPVLPTRRPPVLSRQVSPQHENVLKNEQVAPALNAFCDELRSGGNNDIADRLAALTATVQGLLSNNNKSADAGRAGALERKIQMAKNEQQKQLEKMQEQAKLMEQWKAENEMLRGQVQNLQAQIEEEQRSRAALKQKLMSIASEF